MMSVSLIMASKKIIIKHCMLLKEAGYPPFLWYLAHKTKYKDVLLNAGIEKYDFLKIYVFNPATIDSSHEINQ